MCESISLSLHLQVSFILTDSTYIYLDIYCIYTIYGVTTVSNDYMWVTFSTKASLERHRAPSLHLGAGGESPLFHGGQDRAPAHQDTTPVSTANDLAIPRYKAYRTNYRHIES